MPMARSSIQNLETSKKQMKDESVLRGEVEEANLVPEIESKQEKNDEKNEHKETVDDSRSEDKEYIRYKSYDQVTIFIFLLFILIFQYLIAKISLNKTRQVKL